MVIGNKLKAGLLLSLTAFIFNGCGKKEEKLSEITVMTYERGIDFIQGNSTENNEMTRWINEQVKPLGIKVKFVGVPRASAEEKINLMLSGGQAPDIIFTYDRERFTDFASKGGLMDFKPYMNMFDKEFISRYESAFRYGELDGKQFSIPRIFMDNSRTNVPLLREDLVEKMGMKQPETKEELIEVLYKMKENYPDITPFGMPANPFSQPYKEFVLSYTSRKNERDNYIYDTRFTDVLKPGGKEGFKVLNQLYVDGIIDKNFVLDTQKTKFKQDIANGKIGFSTDESWLDIFDSYRTITEPNYRFMPVDVFNNIDGNKAVLANTNVSNYVFVPKVSEKRAEHIVKFINWIAKDESYRNILGYIIGKGSTLGSDGVIQELPVEERKKLGLNTIVNDLSVMVREVPYDKAWLTSLKKSRPFVPEKAFDKIYDYKIMGEKYDPVVITTPLKSNKYMPALNKLIVEFAQKVISAPEGKFEEVWAKEYAVLVENKIDEVFEERAAFYDNVIAKKK